MGNTAFGGLLVCMGLRLSLRPVFFCPLFCSGMCWVWGSPDCSEGRARRSLIATLSSVDRQQVFSRQALWMFGVGKGCTSQAV
jgi:hypothetical protein